MDPKLRRFRRGFPLHLFPLDQPAFYRIGSSETDIFHSRKCRDQDVVLKDNVDPQLPALFRPDRLREIFSVPQDVSAVSLIDTAEDLDERGFSGSVLTDEAMDLPLTEREVQTF